MIGDPLAVLPFRKRSDFQGTANLRLRADSTMTGTRAHLLHQRVRLAAAAGLQTVRQS